MKNHWLQLAQNQKFHVGDDVRIRNTVHTSFMSFVGMVGVITSYDKDFEMYGVYFGNGPKWIAGRSWNEFFEHELELL